jgi:branched-subunit amino acid transport protein
MTDWHTVITLVGLALLTVITRAFFLIPKREVPLPAWFHQGLRFAPLGALVGVVATDVVMRNGQLIGSWQDARLIAAAVGVAFFYWRRSMLGTIVVGVAVMLALQRGLGW